MNIIELWSNKTTECNWDGAFKFADRLNEEKHLGRTDWRVPKLWELLRAYDLKINGFDKASWFWSSSGNVSYSDGAWGVYFYDGYASYDYKSVDRHVRCVVSGTSHPLLGLATTAELIDEVRARIEVDGKLDYRTVGE